MTLFTKQKTELLAIIMGWYLSVKAFIADPFDPSVWSHCGEVTGHTAADGGAHQTMSAHTVGHKEDVRGGQVPPTILFMCPPTQKQIHLCLIIHDMQIGISFM